MCDGFSTIGILLGDKTRATMLLSLMGGIALPAGELARIANVAPQTASEHLTKLVSGHLLTVERQGRHRYYRLSSTQVADALEALLVLTARPRVGGHDPDKGATTGTLAHARTCYAHLTGWLGVRVAESLQERALLTPHDAKTYTVKGFRLEKQRSHFAAIISRNSLLRLEVRLSRPLNRPDSAEIGVHLY